jgi:hypothetical protein
MTYEDWIKILEENSREDWLWYARWLQDENNDDIRAEAINFILENNIEPHYSTTTQTYDWWSKDHKWVQLSWEYKYSLIDFILFKNLWNYEGICKDYWVGYKTMLDAKLALIEAWVLSKMGTCANRKSDLV